MTGYPPIDATRLEPSHIQQADCGTCPVTIACAIGQGGTGYVFKCCGSTAVETRDPAGDPVLLIIDCARHGFENHDELLKMVPSCPLCDGGIIDDVLLKLTTPCAWVPTVHSRVPVETRLDTWRRELPKAVARAAALAARKGAAPRYTGEDMEDPKP